MLLRVSALLMLPMLLAGCAMDSGLPADPEARIAAVKKATQATERKVVNLLSSGDVASVKQIDEGSFLSCSNGYQWSGNIRATLSSGVVGDDAQRDLASSAAKQGFEVSEDRMLRGGRRYELVNKEGARLLVTVWNDGTVLDIDSFSQCFSVPADYDPPRLY